MVITTNASRKAMKVAYSRCRCSMFIQEYLRSGGGTGESYYFGGGPRDET